MISFIYFDVGGVLIKDFSKTNKWELMKRDLGIRPERDIEVDLFFDEYEPKGNAGLPIESLIPLFEKNFGIKLPANCSLNEEFAIRFEKNLDIWPLVSHQTLTHKVGLLTNMYPGLLSSIKEHGLLPQTNYDVVIDSSQVGYAKPFPEIYQVAQDKAAVPANEILFVDNTDKNLTVPKHLGWQTFLFDSLDYHKSTQALSDFLDNLSN